MNKTDTQIKQSILEELQWDARVAETDVGVEVHSGIVTLTGTVDSWAARLAAQEAAHRVAGVFDVANDVHVKLPGSSERTDADIAKAVREALQWDALVPDDRIYSTVSNGVVMLEGAVDNWTQYDDAERCIRNLTGVVEVKNLVLVEPSVTSASPKAIRSAIEKVLERHAEYAAKRVHLAIADGKVILSGDVPTRAERQAIEVAVRHTRGVGKVDNQLRIQPS